MSAYAPCPPRPGPNTTTVVTLAPHDVDPMGAVFQLVAAAYRPPGAALHDDLEGGAFEELATRLAEDLEVAPPHVSGVALAVLRERHVALFVTNANGVAAPPYIGFAVDDELLGDTFQELGATFGRYGIEVQGGWRDLPDHVAAVAEGGALLLEAGHTEGAREVLTRYLAPWFARFAPAVAAADIGGFYGSLTPFLDAVIRKVADEDTEA